MERQARFMTEQLIVTGNSPDELENAALGKASVITGRPRGCLRISGSYTVHAVPLLYHTNLTAQENIATTMADRAGHQLWAAITVCEYLPATDPAAPGN